MKKILLITILILLVLSIPVIAGIHNNRRSSEKCTVRNCNIERYEDSPYCRYHKCGIFGCNSRRELYGVLCPFHREQKNQRLKKHNSRNNSSGTASQSRGKNSASASSGSRKKSFVSGSSGSGKTSFDPDDHDIESYYDDFRDEYDDYDDAYDGFLDDDDAWDDY